MSSDTDTERCDLWETAKLGLADNPVTMTDRETANPHRVNNLRLSNSILPNLAATLRSPAETIGGRGLDVTAWPASATRGTRSWRKRLQSVWAPNFDSQTNRETKRVPNCEFPLVRTGRRSVDLTLFRTELGWASQSATCGDTFRSQNLEARPCPQSCSSAIVSSTSIRT